jgi:hypothetical protein
MKEHSGWKDRGKPFPSTGQNTILASVDDAFVEHWTNAAIERGAFAGETADQVRRVVRDLLANLEHTMELGERFSLDTVEPQVDGSGPVYFQKTARGLVIAREEIPPKE